MVKRMVLWFYFLATNVITTRVRSRARLFLSSGWFVVCLFDFPSGGTLFFISFHLAFFSLLFV